MATNLLWCAHATRTTVGKSCGLPQPSDDLSSDRNIEYTKLRDFDEEIGAPAKSLPNRQTLIQKGFPNLSANHN